MSYTVGQFASQPVYTVDVRATVMQALELMSSKQISCVVVLDHAEPIGILTERDVIFASNWVLGQKELMIREVMNKPVLTTSRQMSIDKARDLFREHRIRHLVVLDDRLDMDGIFTQTDLVRALRQEAFVNYQDISTLMSSQVLQVAPDVSARYALSLMARRAVSCVVVVEGGSPRGVFTERDVVRLVAEGVDLTTVPVGLVMSSSLVTASVDTPPMAAISLMQNHAVRRLVVLDPAGQMTGVLTQTDLGRALDPYMRGHLHPAVFAAAGQDAAPASYAQPN
ncbi:MAG: CBS domain-containing protein [Desulfuromonadales bacterium]|nr:CBS domain-containing protein [Desulfuromonadales bacterium]